MKKSSWLSLIVYAGCAAAALVYQDTIVHAIETNEASLLEMAGVAFLFAFVPVIPFGVIAALLGAQYGALLGGLMNVLCSTAAAVLFFFIVRGGFQEQSRAWLAKYGKAERWMSLLEQHAFLTILTARIIPVIPAVAVHIICAVSHVSLRTFAVATLLGKIPVMVVFAAMGDHYMTSPARAVWTGIIYMGILAVLLIGFRLMRPLRRN
ncbi:hypothetical protein XYCOK13_14860 [Xylanibacillus composti]|uniref:TVP38/TMEM64 family membrane protein n=1 Tax=Xylanibacillus composti TaxID=1572762 RepID=A0A8J4M284_9BACL|nr:VTT domain-containing protein [Xylanibacillus composti]GIQ68662.1 hypothetical protein XYCOK13_14860 [Xylanibacillus composti]